MPKQLQFVKIHAGWDECVFLFGDQIPDGKELEMGLPIIKPPHIRGTELGILYSPEGKGDIKVKMMDATSNDFISMCGGLTQSLGKAIVEHEVGEKFNIPINEPLTEVTLETDSGLIPINILVDNGEVTRVWTNMTSYFQTCYDLGVEKVQLTEAIEAVSVGVNSDRAEFLILNVGELEQDFPKVNFWSRDKKTLDILADLYQQFLRMKNLEHTFLYGALYDWTNADSSTAQAVFRFWPSMGEQEMEYGCGTGSTAIGIAMAERDELNPDDENNSIQLNIGDEDLITRPQVRTGLEVETKNGKPIEIKFSHSFVESLASGQLWVNR